MQLSEPTYQEVVILYRLKEKPKYSKDKAADRFAKMAAEASGVSSDLDDRVRDPSG